MPVITTKAELKDKKEKKVLKHLKEAQELLDFLVGVSDDERVRMQRIKRRPTAFIQRTKLHMETSPESVPIIAGKDDFLRITDLLTGLRQIDVELDHFHKKVKDTITVAESDAYTLARLYYKAMKQSARIGDRNAERIYQDMLPYFKPGKPRKKNEEETEQPDEGLPETTDRIS